MRLIVAVDQNWGIGRDGKLLFSIPEDLKRFRKLTSEGIVIMGRSTLDSLPGRKPLPNRTNLILSHDAGLTAGEAMICHSVEDVLRAAGAYDDARVWVIGGEAIYRQLLDYCSEAYVTKIDAAAPGADRFFPNLDRLQDWELREESEPGTYNGLRYSFCVYRNQRVRTPPAAAHLNR